MTSTVNSLKNKACVSVGKMLDHAVYSLHQNAEAFFALFISSGVASGVECQDVRLVAGMSGIELAYEVMDRCGIAYDRVSPRHTMSRSKEYCVGHALAQIQGDTGIRYEELIKIIPLSGMISLYEKYHDKAVSDLPWQLAGNERRAAVEEINTGFAGELKNALEAASSALAEQPARKETHLKEMRLRNGLSQSQLAAASDVPVRTIQQYEQRQKNINKAQFESVIMLSRVLNCDPEQLMER